MRWKAAETLRSVRSSVPLTTAEVSSAKAIASATRSSAFCRALMAGTRSTLAAAAEHGAAAADPHEAERPPAVDARLAGATVDQELLLLPPLLAPGVDVVVDGAAAVADPRQQRLAERVVQADDGRPAELTGGAIRPDAR